MRARSKRFVRSTSFLKNNTMLRLSILFTIVVACIAIAPAGCAPSAPAKRVGDVVAVESVEIVPADAADLKMPSAVEEVSAASKQRANSAIQEADKAIEAAKGSIHAASQSAATEKVLLGESSLTAGVPGSGPITLEQIDSWLANPKNHTVIQPILPLLS